MAIAFPTPNMGDPSTLIVTEAGITWTWNNTLGVWSTDISSASDDTAIGDTPPASPQEGDLWWNSSDDSGRLYVYYDDGDSQQWVEASPQVDSLTEEQSDNRYLSKVSDDTAEGAITFEALTTHEAGVSVTGGTQSGVDTGIALEGQLTLVKEGVTAGAFNPQGNSQFTVGSSDRNKTLTGLQGISSMWSSANHGTQTVDLFYGPFTADINTSGTVNGMRVVIGTTQTGTGQFVGYRSVINNSNVPNGQPYNFYAGGDAPNYFKGLTQHAGGVSVTGGDKDTIGKGLVSSSTRLSIQSNRAVDVNSTILSAYHSGNVGGGLTVNSTFDFSSTLINANLIGVQDLELLNATENDTLSIFSSSTSNTNSPSSSVGTCNNFVASASTTYGSNLNIGFRSNLNVDGSKNFNFYAAGAAPNYFAGTVIVSKDTNSTSEILGGTKTGMYFNASTGGIAINKDDNNGNLNLMQCMRGGTATTRRFLDFRFSGTTNKLIGWIDATESAVAYRTTSDYRLKENIAPLTSASDRVKQLNPCSFNFIGVDETAEGFIAHEIQEVVPATASGTKDETEAIGTLIDWDGTELETEVIEPSAEELTYTEEVETDGVATMVTRTRSWSATGNRPVYQGVDQTKLIPLLTKALQEVMQKNEDLEARIAALEGA